MFISLQVQNSNVLKDLGTACSAELKSRGRGPGFAWAQDTNGRPPTVMLGSYDGPWVLPSGKVVFATKADITGAGAAVPINEHLNGDAVTSGHVWTGVDNKGVSKPDASCNGWTKSTTDLKAAGSTIPTLGANWANDGTLLDCHGQNYLICFEL